ncbi:ADP-ribosylglycohydrolase family protein [Hymenobacter jeollabukensis]|uniref:ADP-ribosylglycohydrolase family protein n=1 Tax=Hymenobacter jeollabukensis TaxID=2025313 RepID=A0A5R8WPZ4_9BACT|nr:ADP-ribosylglycohydrolase family protein [Hymenobacter jeollabukensis]TLM91843.1 ADP-ribosylglycohydrolase family protein [Hymenobacter jeollabukensis]
MPVTPSSAEAQIRAALLGLAVGDALGVPVEFESRARRKTDPVVTMRAYGTHNQPAGTWSDDASLTFCLAQAIADGFTVGMVAEYSCRWYYQNLWTPHGHVFDIGITTREALQRLKADPDLILAGGTDEYSNGNGALMRVLPLAFYQVDMPLEDRFRLIHEVSAITHGHIRSAVACWLYLEMARHLRAGLVPAAAYAQLCAAAPAQLLQLNIPAKEAEHFERILSGRLPDVHATAISSGGYVLHTLESALWCLLRYESYAETVLAAVNLGDDTDTTGAVTGGLAGLYYGEQAIPPEWLQVLARRADIEDLAARMANELSVVGG